MKGKFVTGILTLAVLLGLLLVPAVGVTAMPPAGKATFVMPAEVYVVEDQAFAVNVTLWNPNGVNTTSASIDLQISDPGKLNVTGIVDGDWTLMPGKGWDNATGEIWHNGGNNIGEPYRTTDVLQCTIHFLAGNVATVVTVNFTQFGDTADTVILDPASDDVCNWTHNDIQNMTVKIGTPKLTVDVDPADKGNVSISGGVGIPPGGYPNVTSWGWGVGVNLTPVEDVAGWEFDYWSGNLTGNTTPGTVTMDELTKSVTAHFVEQKPHLGVSTNSLAFTARYGANEETKTVDISNTGGHVLCWALGSPPKWTAGDSWTYWNTYDTVPNPSPPPTFLPYPNQDYDPTAPCTVNNTTLVLTVDGEDTDNYLCTADWPDDDPQRTDSDTGAAVCMHDASVVVDKCTLDYVQQVANMTLWFGPDPGQNATVQASVTWAYDDVCHGWPYYNGKTWTYNMTIVVPVVGTRVVPAQATVVGPLPGSYGDLAGTYQISHFSPDIATGQLFMQQYWSDAVRNIVLQWDVGTFNAPPADVRILLTQSPAPAAPPAVAPSWLSFDKTHSDPGLGIDQSETLAVTANSSTLAVGIHEGNFTISGCGCVEEEVVDVSFEVKPATTIDVIRDLPADALNLDAEYPGDTFFVYVNFTAPVDEFNSIGLTDRTPAGWKVTHHPVLCSPPNPFKGEDGLNKAEYLWSGSYPGYNMGTQFSAVYEVTIPETATRGINEWPLNDCDKAWVKYYFGPEGPHISCITGDYQKLVTVPGKEWGEVRDVNADLLTGVMVTLYETPKVLEDSCSSTGAGALYENDVDDTGTYFDEAAKYWYFTLNTSDMPVSRTPWHELYKDFTTAEKLCDGYELDFEGDYGLVPTTCTMSYAMESVNHWLFTPIDASKTPHPEWQLSSWKAMESVHSWQFPTGP